MCETKLCVPENLNIDQLIEENKEDFKNAKLRKPMLLYICDAVLKSRASNSKQMEDRNTKFTPLWSKVLDDVVHNYSNYLNFLLKNGVLISDNYFN